TSRSVENGRLRCPVKNRRSAGRVTREVKRQAQAAAINQTDCGDRTDFVKVWYDGGARTMCFANGGTVTLQLPDVSKVTSGDNNVAMFLGARAVTMNKWSTLVDTEGLNATLHALQIY
ncbi:beta/gamma crystallin domain-containing protein, partial [Streptomyces sp. NPDC093808]|uniref:beta/gamma crystallin domain-containing protein n=1 Tax=Streptomyces sp. NPDC093808 TaxID=3154985 RepID=UPI00344CC3D3